MKPLLLTVSLLLAVACGVAVYLQHEQQLDSKFVVLRFDREGAISGGLCNVDVFVNRVKVGSVGNGRTEKFRFTSGPDGNNTIYATMVPRIGPDFRSNTVQFKAREGEVVYARYEVDSWVMKMRPDTRLEVAPLKTGAERRSFASAAPDDGGKSSKPSWEAISAITGVLSLIVAVVALFKPS
ncbi:MAG: hypothetical protein JWO97_3707 [Acidobacteria bacterium]|nr:hypothetical protein [Acidobacteriota bacterium]